MAKHFPRRLVPVDPRLGLLDLGGVGHAVLALFPELQPAARQPALRPTAAQGLGGRTSNTLAPMAAARCALPSADGARCGQCLLHPPAYERSQAAFVYAFPLDRLVRSFKYHGTLAYADWFAQAMLERRTTSLAADVLIPLPLARSRQRERGFNQALEIARPLARWTGIPLSVDTAVRVRDTPPQASLPWSERAKNIRGAFACSAALTEKRVIVIDDVMTTGASLDEFAKTLKRAGAASVENWLIARTLPPAGD
jgi:ComF family protein